MVTGTISDFRIHFTFHMIWYALGHYLRATEMKINICFRLQNPKFGFLSNYENRSKKARNADISFRRREKWIIFV